MDLYAPAPGVELLGFRRRGSTYHSRSEVSFQPRSVFGEHDPEPEHIGECIDWISRLWIDMELYARLAFRKMQGEVDELIGEPDFPEVVREPWDTRRERIHWHFEAAATAWADSHQFASLEWFHLNTQGTLSETVDVFV